MDCIDATVSQPLQPSLQHAEIDAKRPLAKRTTVKVMKYAADCNKSGWSFSPIVALTSAQWSSSTNTLLTKMARRQRVPAASMGTAFACGLQLLQCFPIESDRVDEKNTAAEEEPIILEN